MAKNYQSFFNFNYPEESATLPTVVIIKGFSLQVQNRPAMNPVRMESQKRSLSPVSDEEDQRDQQTPVDSEVRLTLTHSLTHVLLRLYNCSLGP